MKFYVYSLCYPDGAPFYIGKTSGDPLLRPQFHIDVARKGDLQDKSFAIRSILDSGCDVVVKTLHESDSEVNALQYEKRAIIMYDKIYNLTNRMHAKKKPKQVVIGVRWKIKDEIYTKIKIYKALNGFNTIEEAAIDLLEKITEPIHLNLQ